MALLRLDPTRELDSLQSDVNRIFDRFFEGRPANGASASRRWIPAMDLAETDDHLVLRADLPGLTREDVNIEIKDRVLTISGERSTESERQGEGFHRVERSFGRFSRALNLPQGVDPDQVAAGFENGVLEVKIPKPEEQKPTTVQIEAGVDAPKALEGSATEKTEK